MSTWRFGATCGDCNGPLTLETETGTDRRRIAHTRCTECGCAWRLVVTATPQARGPIPRLPWAPVEALLPNRCPRGLGQLSEASGVSRRELVRGRATGVLTPSMADRVAVGFSMHPGEVWGDDWWNLP